MAELCSLVVLFSFRHKPFLLTHLVIEPPASPPLPGRMHSSLNVAVPESGCALYCLSIHNTNNRRCTSQVFRAGFPLAVLYRGLVQSFPPR